MIEFKRVDLTKIDLNKAQLAVSLAVSAIQSADEIAPKPYFARNNKDMDEDNNFFGRIYQVRENKYLLLVTQDHPTIAAGLESNDFIYLLSVFCVHIESFIYTRLYQPLKEIYADDDIKFNSLEQELAKSISTGYELAIKDEDLLKIAESEPSLRKYCVIDNKIFVDAINNEDKKYRLISLSCFENHKSNDRIYFYYTKHAYSIYLILIAMNESTSINTIIEIPENDKAEYRINDKTIEEVANFVSEINGNIENNQMLTDAIIYAIIRHIDGFKDEQHIYIDEQTFGFMYNRDLKNAYIVSLDKIVTTICGETIPTLTFEKAVERLSLLEKIRLFSIIDVINKTTPKLQKYLNDNTLECLNDLLIGE